MSTATTSPPRPRRATGPARPRRRTVALEVRDTPDVLVRVLQTLRRRGCVVLAVDYRAADPHRPACLDVAYEPPRHREHVVAAWLANLVDVLAVQDRGV